MIGQNEWFSSVEQDFERTVLPHSFQYLKITELLIISKFNEMHQHILNLIKMCQSYDTGIPILVPGSFLKNYLFQVEKYLDFKKKFQKYNFNKEKEE